MPTVPHVNPIMLNFVVLTCDIFENSFEIKHKLEKYLKGSCKLVYDLHFSIKYILKPTFVKEISPN